MSCFHHPDRWVVTCDRCEYELPAQPTLATAYEAARTLGWLVLDGYAECAACRYELRRLTEVLCAHKT